jgi:hypothetical protein
MNEKELLENILAADILILAKCKKIHKEMQGTHGDYVSEAIRDIKKSRHDLIAKLLAAD